MASPASRWGWHALEGAWARRIVAEARITPGSWVLDIGAGEGALTAPLLASGAKVIAVEAHPGRARHLRQRFGGRVIVVEADAATLRLPGRPYHVVANPPFAVTSAVLRRLLQPGSRMLSAHLVLQDQAARRWAAPSAPGSRRWGQVFTTSLGAPVPRSAFRPPPAVAARVLCIRRRPRW